MTTPPPILRNLDNFPPCAFYSTPYEARKSRFNQRTVSTSFFLIFLSRINYGIIILCFEWKIGKIRKRSNL